MNSKIEIIPSEISFDGFNQDINCSANYQSLLIEIDCVLNGNTLIISNNTDGFIDEIVILNVKNPSFQLLSFTVKTPDTLQYFTYEKEYVSSHTSFVNLPQIT